jgi:hypothetical protein
MAKAGVKGLRRQGSASMQGSATMHPYYAPLLPPHAGHALNTAMQPGISIAPTSQATHQRLAEKAQVWQEGGKRWRWCHCQHQMQQHVSRQG